MPTRNINLTDQFDAFVEKLISKGTYKNASEVMRAGLRLLQSQETAEKEKLKLLKSLATEGFQSLDQGQGVTLDDEDSLRDHIAAIGKRAAKRTA